MRLPPLRATLAALLGLIAAVAGAGQRFSLAQSDRSTGEQGIARLHKLPGQILSEGKNDQPVGILRLKRYRLEEIEVPPTEELRVAGRSGVVTRAWRLTITGGPFPVRDMPALIWLDGVKLGVGVESSDLTQISVIILDRSLLKDRGKIAISYTEDRSDEIELPEPLSVPAR